MKTKFRYISLLRGLLCCLCAAAMAACSSDEATDVPAANGKLTGITIQLGTETSRDTRVGGDPNALQGEFIHSLWLFIVNDQGIIEKAIRPTAAELGDAATTGDLYEKTFSDIELTPGKKTIYAFANMDEYEIYWPESVESISNCAKYLSGELGFPSPGAGWEVGIDNFKEGSEFPLTSSVPVQIEEPVYTFYSYNNAGERLFIPMSVMQDVTFTGNGQSVRVELVRLFSRLQFKISNNRNSDVVIDEMRIRRFASDVALYAGGSLYDEQDDRFDIAYYWTGEGKGNGPTLSIPAGGSIEGYVYAAARETEAENPFRINGYLQGDIPFSGTLSRKTLPRNSILPIAINFSDYEFKINATANIAPIGGYPVEVFNETGTVTGNFSIALPEGSQFSLSCAIEKEDEGRIPMKAVTFRLADGASADGWRFDKGLPYTIPGEENTNPVTVATITGIVSAMPGLSTTLAIDTETSEGRKATYTVGLTTKGIEEFSFITIFRAESSPAHGKWVMPKEGYLIVPLQ